MLYFFLFSDDFRKHELFLSVLSSLAFYYPYGTKQTLLYLISKMRTFLHISKNARRTLLSKQLIDK